MAAADEPVNERITLTIGPKSQTFLKISIEKLRLDNKRKKPQDESQIACAIIWTYGIKTF